MKNNSKAVEFKGKLEIIDLSRNVVLDEKAEINNGCTYVPLEFFEEFFNETHFDGQKISVEPVVYELD